MPRAKIAVLLWVAAFGLYGVTAGKLAGYEPETAAVSEGLVQSGQLHVPSGSPLAQGQGVPGRGGHRYSRTGLTQPVLEAPFYWVGQELDRLASGGKSYRWRLTAVWLFEPAMAALTVLAIFALLLLREVPERRALGLAALCAVGTLIWPYSKIGMDTTLMAMVALSAVAAAWTAKRPTTGRFALTGLAVALAMNSKPYGTLLALGVVTLLAGAFREQLRLRRIGVIAAFAAPVILGALTIAWYNWYRTGSITHFGDQYLPVQLVSMPFDAIGLLLSPGKGLLFYSPLVILGLIGLRELWRADRPLARAIAVTGTVNVLVIATSLVWSDETWGPRYLLPSAWLLVLPIAWWARGRARLRWLGAAALIGICIQFVGVFANYGVTLPAIRVLTGEPVYLYGACSPHPGPDDHDPAPGCPQVAYGDDGPRWIPMASPMLLQAELTAAYLEEKLTGSGFVVTYGPWRGHAGAIDLRHPERTFAPLPDFWWTLPGESTKQDLIAVLLGLLGLGSGAMLGRRLLVAQTTTGTPLQEGPRR